MPLSSKDECAIRSDNDRIQACQINHVEWSRVGRLCRQICNLEEQLEQFREELENKSEEVQQLHMQLEIQRKEIISQQDYLETRDSLIQVLG